MESNKLTKEVEGEKKPEGDAAAAAKSMECDRRNDCDDAESSSGSEPPSSSSQGTSGGAGYSGDYSSISDSSETGGSQSKPEGGKKISVNEPILKNKGGKYARRQQKRTNKSTEGVDANLPDADRSSEHIHHYHHHRQAPSLYSQDANSDEDINMDINRKISEIMSLYKVSLHAQRDVKNAARAHLKMNAEAAAKQAAESTSLDLPLQVENSQPQNVLANSQRRTSQQMSSADQDEAHGELMDSSECYAHLVEACRPFFNDSRSLMTTEKPLPPIQVNAGTDEAHSSSGFTSFFTTTNQSGSNSNNGGSGGSSNDSSNQKKASPQAAETNSHTQQMEQDNAADNDTSSETSSLVVQARVKRKYKEKSRRTSSSNSDQTNTNQNINVGSEKNDVTLPSKRVRIETVALDVANAKSKEKTKAKQHQQRTESSSLTSSLSASTETNSAPKAKAEKGETNKSQGASTSAKPRVVTESSSGTTTANNSSGSGNDNNTTSKSESGGDGNSDEQKLPGDRDSTSETGAGDSQEEQQKPSSHTQPIAKTDKPLIHHHHHTRDEKKSQEEEDVLDPSASAERQDEEDALVSKEKRLEKKRKRRESRREYEEELRQMRDSSENNSDDAALEPGIPVTLEEVLSLTKTARLLVQALPPFLAVHINAGFTNLCGIQSSAIIGRPVSTFLSLPSSKEGESSGSDNANSREESDKMSSLSGSGSADDAQNGSSSVIANGGGQVGDAAALAGGNFQNRPLPLSGLRIDRLIVARGYGHIHVVELECHSRFQDQHAHAIEGSEVKFIEGNKPSKRKKTNPKLLCRMSVSPVVSASARNQPETSQKGADSNSGTKRRKHRHPSELQSVKHYLIQLEAANGPRALVSGSSSGATDTTLEAQLLGITKAEVQARRCRLETRPEQHVGNEVQQQQEAQQQDHEDSVDDNSSSAMELVATCG